MIAIVYLIRIYQLDSSLKMLHSRFVNVTTFHETRLLTLDFLKLFVLVR